MPKKWISLKFIFAVMIQSCNIDTPETRQHQNKASVNQLYDSVAYANREKHFGISIINDAIRGAGFSDSTGKTNLFVRWLKVQIINDTTFPVRLEMNFSNTSYKFFNSNGDSFKAFLFPTTQNRAITHLNMFTKNKLQRSTSLNEIILPGKAYSVNVGLLFNTPNNGLIRCELYFKNQKQDLSTADKLISMPSKTERDLTLSVMQSSHSTYYSIFNCGKLSFSN